MAQLTRSGPSTAPTGVITVADLLSRYAPDPMVEPEPATAPVSVESLLRREGRAAAAEDVREDADDESRRPAGHFARRGAVAAGVLVAAGSVFGAVVVNTTSSTEFEPPRAAGGDSDHPGAGYLDQQPAPDGAIPVVVDPAAQTEPLDPGEAAPTSWMRTAFPGGGSDGSGPMASDPAPQSPAAATPAGPAQAPAGSVPQANPPADAPAGGDGADQGVPAEQFRTQQTPTDTDDDPAGSGGDDRSRPDAGDDQPSAPATPERSDGVVSGLVKDVGGALPEPLSSPVKSLGQTVSDLI